MKEPSSSSDASSTLKASNEYLNRELERLEAERDAIRRELQQLRDSYAGRLIDTYRRWIARHRDNVIIGWYERLALWILDRTTGRREHERDPLKRYNLWLEAHRKNPQSIEALKAEAAQLPYRPLISVVLQAQGSANQEWLTASIESIRGQWYDNWELCIACEDASQPSLTAMLNRCVDADARITMTPRGADLRDSLRGEFITLLDQSGQLAADAFYEVVRRLNRVPLLDLFYWDEDLIDRGGRRTEPFFKPDWSPDLLLSMNYFGECFVLRRTLLEGSGCMPGSYSLALRVVERTDRIVHIPNVLYHRRDIAPSSVSDQRDSRSVRAISDALRRRGKHARVEAIGPGLHAVRYHISGEPLVSILIPTRDNLPLLRQCLDSIRRTTDYKNYEIIVLDNESREPQTLQYFKEPEDRVQIRHCPGRFNFSAINNKGAAGAKGDFLLFLNNDTQVMRPEWLRAMIEQAQRPEVGAVGAKLLFADGRIQHAGIVLGISGLVGHAFRHQPGHVKHYFGLSDVIRNCSAVTAACMMMRRSAFEEVGGFEEQLSVEFNDVDLCLRLRQRGYLIVYTPLALLHHYESSTRRRTHVFSDQTLFLERWGSCLRSGDPYYNRNLTLAHEDWSIAL